MQCLHFPQSNLKVKTRPSEIVYHQTMINKHLEKNSFMRLTQKSKKGTNIFGVVIFKAAKRKF